MNEFKKRKPDSRAPFDSEPTRRAMELTDFRDDRSDPLGSYTGRPADPNEIPVQDADDL